MANASHEIEPVSSLPAKNKNETLYLLFICENNTCYTNGVN